MIGDEPVFPGQVTLDKQGLKYGSGITLRHIFAGLAMQGYVASTPDVVAEKDDIARKAVELADSLLAELERTRS